MLILPDQSNIASYTPVLFKPNEKENKFIDKIMAGV